MTTTQLILALAVLSLLQGFVVQFPIPPWGHAEYLAWLAAGNTPEPADPPPAPDTAALRRAAYAAEADPIFFLAQRGEATQAEWLAKMAEIRARYPMPEAP